MAPVLLLMLSMLAWEASATEVSAWVTGRLSMSDKYPVQCQMTYTGPEDIQGYPVVGVDGTTFGSLHDGVVTGVCGKTVTIDGVVHIVVDRIWENDGESGGLYDDKQNADRKINRVGEGYPQYDTAKYTFFNRGGNNVKINLTAP